MGSAAKLKKMPTALNFPTNGLININAIKSNLSCMSARIKSNLSCMSPGCNVFGLDLQVVDSRVREQKRALLLKEKRASSGPSSSPRIIVLCALSSTANPIALANDLLKQLAGEETDATSATIASPVYRWRTTVSSHSFFFSTDTENAAAISNFFSPSLIKNWKS